MKHLILLLTTIFLSLSTVAQAPMGINYQTVIRNGDGDILPDLELTLRMTIRTGAPDGEMVYQETHDVTTNASGLVNLVIGQGVPLAGSFASIAWADGEKFLETAISLDGGVSYIMLGVTQFLSVPYAFYSQKAAAVKDGGNPGEMLYWNGEAWEAIPPGDHDETLRLCNGVPTWGLCRYNLDLLADPSEAGAVSGAGQYKAGEEISISTTTNPGWEFVSWTDDDGIVSETPSFTYTMPSKNITLTAYFVEEQAVFSCGDLMVDTRDDQSYATVQIGDQCWMAENLAYLPAVSPSSQGNDSEPYYYVYNYEGTDVAEAKSTTNYQTYGVLYNWVASLNTCPVGWHLPTHDEWTILTDHVSSQPEYLCNSNTNYIAKALASTTNWNIATGTCEVGNNQSENNVTGFSGAPGGLRDYRGFFDDIGEYGLWWSSTGFSSSHAWYRPLTYNLAYIYLDNDPKLSAFSVRCLKDETSATTHYNLNLEAVPSDAGIVTGEGLYQAGEQVTITAEANTGWEFVSWTDDDGIVSETPSFTYTMPSKNITLTAYFMEEQAVFTCGDLMVDTRDGQSYATVQIGDQCWMAKNLNIGTLINGSSNQTDNDDIEKYCYNNSETNCLTYGGLYQWDEIMGYSTTSGAQGICPEGWHLPTDDEWCTLEQAVDVTITCSSINWRGDDGGGKLKETGFTHWNSPNQGATNSSGFTALPGGYRDSDGSFYHLGITGHWWSSSEDDAYAWYRSLSSLEAKVYRYNYFKTDGHAVRCLKNN